MKHSFLKWLTVTALLATSCRKEIQSSISSVNASQITVQNDTVYVSSYPPDRSDTSAARYNTFTRMATYTIILPSKDSLGSVFTYAKWTLHKTTGVKWSVVRQFANDVRERKTPSNDKNKKVVAFSTNIPLIPNYPNPNPYNLYYYLLLDIYATASPNNYMTVDLDSVEITRNGKILPIRILNKFNGIKKFY